MTSQGLFFHTKAIIEPQRTLCYCFLQTKQHTDLDEVSLLSSFGHCFEVISGTYSGVDLTKKKNTQDKSSLSALWKWTKVSAGERELSGSYLSYGGLTVAAEAKVGLLMTSWSSSLWPLSFAFSFSHHSYCLFIVFYLKQICPRIILQKYVGHGVSLLQPQGGKLQWQAIRFKPADSCVEWF